MTTSRYNLPLHCYAVFTAAATFFLIVAGGLVTSNDAGLAVPDWPLSFGQLMPEMVGGVFYEHGHRMIASGVGLLTVILAFWIHWAERRVWMRKLGWLALAGVIVQGLLGGVTVLFRLPVAVSVIHACLAQSFFCLVSALALFLSRGWSGVEKLGLTAERFQGSIPRWSLIASAGVFMQLILGAVLRHAGTVDGSKAVHLAGPALAAHLLGALLVTVLVAGLAIQILRRGNERLEKNAYLVLGLLLGQLILGVGALLVRVGQTGPLGGLPPVAVTTAHVALGALLLVSLVLHTLNIARPGAGPVEEAVTTQPLAGEA